MGQPFRAVTSALIPLLRDDIDTDQIIPARYLKGTVRQGLGEGLFRDWRVDGRGALKEPPFVLDKPGMSSRAILLAGHNFGCGSSREHAPWALLAGGIRVVLATGFADIFRNNALKNGLLPISLSADEHQQFRSLIATDADTEVTVDLAAQQIRLPSGDPIAFQVDPFARQMILAGTDQTGWLLDRSAALARYEAEHPARYDTRSPGPVA
ncbi:3-isopropylmalate dehydratase small subunit [soil metagenome]